MRYRILQGDVIKRLRDLPGRSVDCVVTSPPYWGLRDYGVPGQIGLEKTPEEYIARMVDVFRDVRRVLRKDGTCWINMGDTYASAAGSFQDDRLRDDLRGYRGDRLANGRGDNPAVLRKKTRASRDGSHAGLHTAMAAMGPMTQPNRKPIAGLKQKDMVGIPWLLAFALRADGWWLRQDIIWAKPNPMPESVNDRCTKAHEYIFLLSKSRLYYFDADAIKEPVTGNAHSRGKGVNPKAVSGWVIEAGVPHDAVNHNRRDTGVGWGRLSELKPKNRRAGRGRIKQNESFSAAVTGMVNTRNKRSVWTVPTQAYPEAHFATFPEKLIQPCVLAGSPVGGLVLDPFSGSGTTGLVALRNRREYIGIELSAEYVAMSKRRIDKAFSIGEEVTA